MLKHAKGNLLDMAEEGKFDAVVQGCNCFNIMGGGIAREIATRYPAAKEVDSATIAGDVMKLGNFTYALIDDTFTIINAYTQFSTSSGQDVFEYEAFGCVLRKLLDTCRGMRIGFPYIGMGLAHGDKDIIIAMIENFAENHAASGGTVTLVEFA